MFAAQLHSGNKHTSTAVAALSTPFSDHAIVLQRADKTNPHWGPETMHQLCNIAADPVETATYGPGLMDRWTEAKHARIAHMESTESAMEHSIHKWQRLRLSRCQECSYKTRLCIVTDQR
jgi:hypothetical protein